MPTLSPSDVLAASDFVARELDRTKRRALAALSAMWETADPDDVAGSLGRFNPLVVQVMNQQQAAGRVTAWTQAQLAASVASDALPGEAVLGISAARDGLMLSGASFEQVIAPTVPGVLSRIAAGVDPGTALDMAQRIQASMVGSVAHDEARATTQDVVEGDSGHSAAITGYARRTEGASTCDFCKMLSSRGFVYSKGTAGFRAHAFCDCTVYAGSMSDHAVDPGDWAAYQRWAKRTPKGATSTAATTAAGTTATPGVPVIDRPKPTRKGGISIQEFRADVTPRLTLVEAQIASYEPVIVNGSATKWMREQVERLYAERDALRIAA